MAPKYDPLTSNSEFLGLTFVNAMRDVKHPVAVVNKEPLSRHEFVRRYGVANLNAARLLTNKLAELKLTDWMDYLQWTPADVAETKGLGVTCVYCLIAVGHAEGFDTDAWLHGTDVTFTSLQLRSRRAHLADTTKKKRKRA